MLEKHEFVSIEGEIERVYEFVKDGEIWKVCIESPVSLSVSRNGHRIIDANGVSYYIPNGWILLSWTTKEGYDPYPL